MKRLSVMAFSLAVFGVSWYILKKKRSARLIPREEFLAIMEEISKSGFDVLFEYAQMVARVSATMKSGIELKSFIENDSNLRFELDNRQCSILQRHNITVDDMMHSQSVYMNDDEVRVKSQSLGNMFDQYCEGSFPVLSWIPSDNRSDNELISVIRELMKARLEGSEGIDLDLSVKNEISKRINEREDFRKMIFSLVVEAQNEVRIAHSF